MKLQIIHFNIGFKFIKKSDRELARYETYVDDKLVNKVILNDDSEDTQQKKDLYVDNFIYNFKKLLDLFNEERWHEIEGYIRGEDIYLMIFNEKIATFNYIKSNEITEEDIKFELGKQDIVEKGENNE